MKLSEERSVPASAAYYSECPIDAEMIAHQHLVEANAMLSGARQRGRSN